MPTTESPTLLDALLPDAPFRERHQRTIAAPLDAVWAACTDVTVGEIRLIGPLMAARALPARLVRRHRRPGRTDQRSRTLIDTFRDEGFVVLHCDTAPVAVEASLEFGAAGRFWSATGNQPIDFADADDFTTFARDRTSAGVAITVADLRAVDNGDGTTTVTTETRVVGTDPAATRTFRRYWVVIRLGSGAIRRSWLAAIDRRARR